MPWSLGGMGWEVSTVRPYSSQEQFQHREEAGVSNTVSTSVIPARWTGSHRPENLDVGEGWDLEETINTLQFTHRNLSPGRTAGPGFPDSSLGLLPQCPLPPCPALLGLTFCNRIGAQCQLGPVSTGGNAYFGNCHSILIHLPTSQLSEGFFLLSFLPLSLPSLIPSSNAYCTTTLCLALQEDQMVKRDGPLTPHGAPGGDSREEHVHTYGGD